MSETSNAQFIYMALVEEKIKSVFNDLYKFVITYQSDLTI